MNRRTFGVTAALAAYAAARRGYGAPSRAGFTRLAYVCDGNWHDRDDWVSSYMSLALMGHAGRQANMVHFSFNCHLEDSDLEWEYEMADSVERGLIDWNHLAGAWNIATEQERTALALAGNINTSAPNNKLCIAAAGPMGIIHLALRLSDRQRHPYVAILSHTAGKYNDVTGTYNLADIRRDFPAVQVGHIPNQNEQLNTGQNFAPWAWMRWTRLDYAYQRMREINRGDTSDAGMVYFALTGNPQPTPADFRRFFGL